LNNTRSKTSSSVGEGCVRRWWEVPGKREGGDGKEGDGGQCKTERARYKR
jgi:hypothetical protein